MTNINAGPARCASLKFPLLKKVLPDRLSSVLSTDFLRDRIASVLPIRTNVILAYLGFNPPD